MTDRRYPLEDLVALLRLGAEKLDRSSAANPFRVHIPSDNEARQMLGLSGSTWARHKTQGLDVDRAEQLAHRAGRHPAEVWPTWYDDQLAEHQIPCPECGQMFVPNTARGQKYCHTRCKQLATQRRIYRERYRSDPAFREAENARRRAYHAANRRAENIKQRARDRRKASVS